MAKSTGRKITVAEKKLHGTYDPKRDKDQELVERALEPTALVDNIEPPEEIKDDYVIAAYVNHVKWLTQYKSLQEIDVSELDQMYITLNHLRSVTKKRLEIENNVDILDMMDEYNKLSQLEVKLRAQFINMGKDFMMTPTVRSKLTIEQLTADKMLTDKKEKENIIEDLFK